MTPVTGAATCVAILAAGEECDRTRRWYRLTCSDADVFERRAARAARAGETSVAREYERQVAAANEARRAAWAEYRRAVAGLVVLVSGPRP